MIGPLLPAPIRLIRAAKLAMELPYPPFVVEAAMLAWRDDVASVREAAAISACFGFAWIVEPPERKNDLAT